MAKVILICGKRCSGKSTYAKAIKEKYNAVILSWEELLEAAHIDARTTQYEESKEGIQEYLFVKCVELIQADVSVILDFGFETKSERIQASTYFHQRQIDFEWHYVEASEDVIKKNIRNSNEQRSKDNKGLLDEKLIGSSLLKFEDPKHYEIDKHVIINY